MSVGDVSRFDFPVRSNNDLFQPFRFEDENGNPIDITGASFRMSIIEGVAGATPLVTLTSPAEIQITDAPNGLFDVSLSNARLVAEVLNASAQDAGSFEYDLVFISSGGIATTLFEGTITVQRGITPLI